VIAAFNDMTLQGAAEFVLRDDGALLMVIRSKATEEVVFKVTRTGLYCLARFEVRRKLFPDDGYFRRVTPRRRLRRRKGG
jgi:hypothetical protein